jgi:hypothetical protein
MSYFPYINLAGVHNSSNGVMPQTGIFGRFKHMFLIILIQIKEAHKQED